MKRQTNKKKKQEKNNNTNALSGILKLRACEHKFDCLWNEVL